MNRWHANAAAVGPGGRSLAIWTVLAALVLAGCGGHPGRVNGRVKLDGSPLTTGVVSFLPVARGAAAYGTIDGEGRYEIRTGASGGLEPGEYVVTVAANAPASAAPQKPAGGPKYAEPMLPLITPLQYALREKSPLRATVAKGSQTLDFDLTSK